MSESYGRRGEVGTTVVEKVSGMSNAENECPFLQVNGGAIRGNLVDTEPFGHEKGAFAGALAQKRGRFERASNRTIFLDKLASSPPRPRCASQEDRAWAGPRPVPMNIRIESATHRSLEQMM